MTLCQQQQKCNTSTRPSRAYINQIQKLFFHGTSLKGPSTWWKHRKRAKLPWRRNSKFSFWSLSFIFLSFFLPSSLLSFCLFVFLSFCLFVFLSFCLYVFLSRHHSDEMSEGLEVSKVTICVKILKWHPVIDSLTKVRYRAARAAKNLNLWRVVSVPSKL